jgi:protein arginine N-methyltransferase 2
MLAAGNGHSEIVELLLQNGAPWNAVDRQGLCAGQYALNAGHQHLVDCLVNAGQGHPPHPTHTIHHTSHTS